MDLERDPDRVRRALARLLAPGEETRTRLDALLAGLPEPELAIAPVRLPFAAN